MKDKLDKTGKTKKYYRKHLAIRISLIALSFVTVCAIPIGVSYRVAEVTHAEADKTTSLVPSEQDENETSSSDLSEN